MTEGFRGRLHAAQRAVGNRAVDVREDVESRRTSRTCLPSAAETLTARARRTCPPLPEPVTRSVGPTPPDLLSASRPRPQWRRRVRHPRVDPEHDPDVDLGPCHLLENSHSGPELPEHAPLPRALGDCQSGPPPGRADWARRTNTDPPATGTHPRRTRGTPRLSPTRARPARATRRSTAPQTHAVRRPVVGRHPGAGAARPSVRPTTVGPNSVDPLVVFASGVDKKRGTTPHRHGAGGGRSWRGEPAA